MPNTATNVTTAKPNAAGAIYVESASTSALPTSAEATITGFTSLGYVSEDGVSNAKTFTTNETRDWGGAVVNNTDTEHTDTFTFTLIEALNVDVLKEVFGTANVSGTLSTGITVSAKPVSPVDKKWIVDMIMRNGVLKRICIPAGAITAVEEVAYNNTDPVGYAITLTAHPNATGVTHYEYIKTPTTPGG